MTGVYTRNSETIFFFNLHVLGVPQERSTLKIVDFQVTLIASPLKIMSKDISAIYIILRRA